MENNAVNGILVPLYVFDKAEIQPINMNGQIIQQQVMQPATFTSVKDFTKALIEEMKKRPNEGIQVYQSYQLEPDASITAVEIRDEK